MLYSFLSALQFAWLVKALLDCHKWILLKWLVELFWCSPIQYKCYCYFTPWQGMVFEAFGCIKTNKLQVVVNKRRFYLSWKISASHHVIWDKPFLDSAISDLLHKFYNYKSHCHRGLGSGISGGGSEKEGKAKIYCKPIYSMIAAICNVWLHPLFCSSIKEVFSQTVHPRSWDKVNPKSTTNSKRTSK